MKFQGTNYKIKCVIMEFELEDVSMSIMGEQIFDLKEILEKKRQY